MEVEVDQEFLKWTKNGNPSKEWVGANKTWIVQRNILESKDKVLMKEK